MSSRIATRFIVAILILGSIGGYAWYESRDLRQGPVIELEKPTNGQTMSTPVADIIGQAKNTTRIRMNDRDIAINEQGAFHEKFVLSNGSNLVKLWAEDRFGRTTESFVEVLYTEPNKSLVLKPEQRSDL